MQQVNATAKTIRELLNNAKFSVDYYQREYKWAKKQVVDLVDDLVTAFQEDYEPGDPRIRVKGYGKYYLGSIILSHRDSQNFVVDGQQRLTTLTLLLIHILHLQQERSDQVNIAGMVFSEQYGQRSFNLQIEDRAACMEALFNDEPFEDPNASESVRNILDRMDDLEASLPDEIVGDALPYFTDWLIDNVYLVEITALSDRDAYTIFETMNDRGLSLTPAEMMKGYMLSHIADTGKRHRAEEIWRHEVEETNKLGKDEFSDFIKAWLRSQFARETRQRKRNAKPEDFDLIGTEFHRWIRDNASLVGLETEEDFVQFFNKTLPYFAAQYRHLRDAGTTLVPGLEGVYYTAQLGLTLQYTVLLAPIILGEDQANVDEKVRFVADFLEIMLARRIWNSHSIDYSTMQYAMFNIIKEIRGTDPQVLRGLLISRLNAQEETFASNDRFRLHGRNRYAVNRILARITDYLDRMNGLGSRYQEYVSVNGRRRYEIEHIWADHPEWFKDEIPHPSDFAEQRNKIGGLLLLPKSFNQSYGDSPYAAKLPEYLKQNTLAQTLHPDFYSHTPKFMQFIQSSGLKFAAHPEFKLVDLDTRQQLYTSLAEHIWNPERIGSDLR